MRKRARHSRKEIESNGQRGQRMKSKVHRTRERRQGKGRTRGRELATHTVEFSRDKMRPLGEVFT
jgi:hypothetical protein